MSEREVGLGYMVVGKGGRSALPAPCSGRASLPPSVSLRSFGALARMRFIFTVASIVLIYVLSGCAATKSYNIPFSRAGAVLFERLHLDEHQALSSPRSVQAKPKGNLAKQMSMELFAVDLHEYTPGTSLSFTCQHLYDIGAVGGQYIRFDLRKQAADKTRVTVDYCDRWYGMWFPFVFWSPGLSQERTILNEIWGRETANKAPTVSARRLADAPVRKTK